MKKDNKEIKKIVKEGYARIAKQETSCCLSGSCCGSTNSVQDISKSVGYSDAEMNAVPEGAISFPPLTILKDIKKTQQERVRK